MSGRARTTVGLAAGVPDFDYARATRRLYYFTIAAGICGLPIISWKMHWPGAAGWVVGVALSLVNLWLWQRVAARLSGSNPEHKGPNTSTLVMRTMLVIAGVYVIVNTLKVNGMALVFGLLASVAGVVAEILFELAAPLAARWK